MKRAYADDLVMLPALGLASLPQLAALFHDFATISCLVLNSPKTVIVPLFHCDREEVGLHIAIDGMG